MRSSAYNLWASDWQPARPNGLTVIDFFCGAGGSALGLTASGMRLLLAANHWPVAIATHSRNFSSADHLCADINNHDMRRLPRANVLWASPICWEVSPAGGNQKPKISAGTPGQTDLFTDEHEPIAEEGWERTRATAYDVLRATEVWKFDAIMIENVVEFATRWPLFWWWLNAFVQLGYQYKIVCVNSAHLGGEDMPFAPQWRNRMYIILLPAGVKMPDLEPRPLAWCADCRENIRARQRWKNTKQAKLGIGKYRQQYVYTCPNIGRRHTDPVVEPYVLPAAAAIDWSNLGTPIGQRSKPLAASTMNKIHVGYAMIGEGPTAVQINHGDHDGRHYPAWHNPMATRTRKGGDGITSPPMTLQVGGNKNDAYPIEVPMHTRITRDIDALITPPYIVEARGGGSSARPADHPFATVTAGGNHLFLTVPDAHITWQGGHALVIPYRKGKAKTTAVPFHTMAVRDSAALVRPQRDVPVEDFRYRMITPREALRAQCIFDDYVVTGNGTEQMAQAGNAVSVNAAMWLGERVAEALGC
ncbi:DNA cytosine methyltransferase [Streptosporangium sandarakinum]|uniref:DNA cytosine methyltransferase n=1 Tax=Streptosporangium sandarakinum TaxID=1260955 RepID=UPI00379FB5F2